MTGSLGDSRGVMSRGSVMAGGKGGLGYSLNNMLTGEDVFRHVLLEKQRDTT